MSEKICEECDKERKIHARGKCRVCYDRWLKANNPEYHERYKADQRERRRAPEALAAAYERHKKRWEDPEYRAKDADRKWTTTLISYGLTKESYSTLVDNGCQICGNLKAAAYHLDHDHTTGAFRGLLCSKCNNGLGMLGDNIEGLQIALNYLYEAEQLTQKEPNVI